MDFKFTAIILNKSDIGETDRLYTFFSLEKGKIMFSAAGVRKPQSKLAASLEPLTFSEIFATKNRGRGRITGAITVNNFSGIKKNISALERIFFALKIFSRLITDEERDERIFNLLKEYLETMEKIFSGDNETTSIRFRSPDLNRSDASECISRNETTLDIITYGFIFQLFHLLGYGIETKKCLKCQAKIQPGENYFSAERGGVICKNCAGKEKNRIKITDDSIKLIRIFLENKLKNLGKIKIEKQKIANLKIVAEVFRKWITE